MPFSHTGACCLCVYRVKWRLSFAGQRVSTRRLRRMRFRLPMTPTESQKGEEKTRHTDDSTVKYIDAKNQCQSYSTTHFPFFKVLLQCGILRFSETRNHCDVSTGRPEEETKWPANPTEPWNPERCAHYQLRSTLGLTFTWFCYDSRAEFTINT